MSRKHRNSMTNVSDAYMFNKQDYELSSYTVNLAKRSLYKKNRYLQKLKLLESKRIDKLLEKMSDVFERMKNNE